MCLVVAEGRRSCSDTLQFPSVCTRGCPSAAGGSKSQPMVWRQRSAEHGRLRGALGPVGTHSRQGQLCGAVQLWELGPALWPLCQLRAAGRDPLSSDPSARAPRPLLPLQSRGWEPQPRREVEQEGGTREGTGGQC